MPTIREYMLHYNELVRIARGRGIRRGPDGNLLHELTNLRCSNEQARNRVGALQGFILADGAAPTNVPAPTWRPVRVVRTRPIVGVAVPPAAIPTTEPTFGCEFECLFPSGLGMSGIAAALNAAGIETQAEVYNHSRRGHWKIVTDGSLRANPGTVAYEIVSPVLSGQAGLEQIAKVCRALNGLGAVVNRSCGFHVHVGVSNTFDNVGFYRRLVRIYKQHNTQIEAVLAPSRRGGANVYSRNFRGFTDRALDQCQTVSEVIHLVNGPDPRNDRYYKLNLNAYFRHRTVEFRQHQGTLDPQKATMWTRFCLKIVAAAAKTDTLISDSSDISGLLTQIEATPEEREYFVARQAHFQTLENQGDI